MKEGYSVTVFKWGEPILAIEPSCLSGADLSYDDCRAIFDAGDPDPSGVRSAVIPVASAPRSTPPPKPSR